MTAADRPDLPEAPDALAVLGQLGAKVTPDLAAYAAGELPAHLVRCVLCGLAPCDCQRLGLTFGSAAYFARLDALHGRTPATPPRTCADPECPATAYAGEHPAGLAVATSGGLSYACTDDTAGGAR